MTLRQVLFGFEGRVNRRVYWSVLIALVLVKALVVATMLMWPWVKEWYLFSYAVHVDYDYFRGLAYVCLCAEIVVWLNVWTANSVKRLRDIDRSVWWAPLTLVPVAPLILGALPSVRKA